MTVASAALAGRVLLAGVLLIAVLGKARDPSGLPGSVERFVPPGLSRHSGRIGIAVVTLEALGAALVFVPFGALVAAGLTAAFGLALGRALGRGDRAPCGCFGPGDDAPIGLRHVLRNVVLTLVAVGVAVAPAARPDPVAPALVTGVVLALAVVRLDDLTAVFTPLRTAG